MVSLWGSRKNNQQGEGEDNMDHDEESQQAESQTREPAQRRYQDERTPLLPPAREGYLSPDDPAVSPSQCPWSPLGF